MSAFANQEEFMRAKKKTSKSNRSQPNRRGGITPPAPANVPLEEAILNAALEPLRESPTRRQIRKKTGASDQAIEQTLNSAAARGSLRRVVAASLAENTATALRKIYAAADRKESWACKVLLEIARVADAFEAGAEISLPTPEEFGLRSAVERSVVENILNLLRGGSHEPDEGQLA